MKKKILSFLFFISSCIGNAQVDYSASWKDYFSYNNVTDILLSNEKLYALTDNAFFIYNLSTQEYTKFSSVNGLSGESTSTIYFSDQYQMIFIGYTSGLIEIVDLNTGAIRAVKDIVNFSFSGEKAIHNFSEYNSKLYIATSFAIVEFDIENLEFGNTFFIGNFSSELKIVKTEIVGNNIYAISENGIYKADLTNENLIDYNNWSLIKAGNFSSATLFNSKLYISSGKILYRLDDTILTQVVAFSETIKELTSEEIMVVTSATKTYFLNSQENILSTINSSDFTTSFNKAIISGSSVFIATLDKGIIHTPTQNSLQFTEIFPDGPVNNNPFSISVRGRDLWVVYGGYSTAYGPLGRRQGISHYNGENWVNIPYSDLLVTDLVNVTFDPYHENKVYVSSWAQTNSPESRQTGGILILENDQFSTFWNQLNSGLESVTLSNPNYTSIRINGMAFDKEGNLWIANAWVPDRIKKLTPQGNWESFDMIPTITNPAFGLNELVIDNQNTIWIGSRRNGVLVFNEQLNLKKSITTEETKGSLPDLNVRTLVADDDNRLWIGTKTGLVVLNNATNSVSQESFDTRPVIFEDDGVAKALLGEQTINSIVIDGAGNKWFATESGGVIQTNSEGSKTLNLFTTSNSPLPSNNVLKIALNKSSGEVFFATANGIVSFNSNVTAYGDKMPKVYAYPNPSTKENDIITIDGRFGEHLPENTNVKILDIAGNLVFETNTNDFLNVNGGKVLWNKTNLAGRKVASGVYIILLSNAESNSTSITKVAIVN